MIPKKTKDYYRDFAEENEFSQALTESIIDFYYKRIRETLVNLNNKRVNVEGLGHFVIKKNLVKKSKRIRRQKRNFKI